eukprot:jgi/Galph1/5122/GphlegSOOS_G3741.1
MISVECYSFIRDEPSWWSENQFCYRPDNFRIESVAVRSKLVNSSLNTGTRTREQPPLAMTLWSFWNGNAQLPEKNFWTNTNVFRLAPQQMVTNGSTTAGCALTPCASAAATMDRSQATYVSRSHVSTTREDPEEETPGQALPTVSKQKQLASLLAGGLAGTLSAAVTCPLEVVKTKLQSSSSSQMFRSGSRALQVAMQIAKTEGFHGFFRGLVPTLVGVIPARSSYFWAYTTSKSMLLQRFGESPLVHMLSAVVAGMVSNTITNPIWMLKTRMQLQAGGNGSVLYTSYADAFQRIVKEEGFRGLYKGLTASYWGVTEGAIHFMVYERLKSWLHQRNPSNKDRLSSFQYLSLAAVSKLIASTTTYPHEVIRTRLREQAPIPGALPKYRSVLQSLRTIAREEGIGGLYCGMGMHLLRVVPNTALMFLTFELVSRWLENHPLLNNDNGNNK